MDNKDYRIGPPLTLQISADLAEKGMSDEHQDICLNSLLLDALHNSRYGNYNYCIYAILMHTCVMC